jgi:hypothetical protein
VTVKKLGDMLVDVRDGMSLSKGLGHMLIDVRDGL